jgi:hypothetical protein
MKTYLVVFSLLLSGFIFANENHPCQKIKAACEAAGFKKGDHKNAKGLWKDCFQPIMNGQTVAGVTVASGDIEACKQKKEERKK